MTGSTAVVNQYLGTTRNWYVSPPLSNAKATTGFTYYRRDETAATWPSVTVGASLTPRTGYIALPETAGTAISFTTENGGTLNAGNVPVTLTKSGSGFNSIGNPYPSHLTWTAAFVNDPTNTALIEPTIWVRTNAKTANSGVDAQWSFITYNAAVSESVPFVNVLIAPMQAFWVKAKGACTLILDSNINSFASCF